MARPRIFTDEERIQRRRAQQLAYYYKKMEDPEHRKKLSMKTTKAVNAQKERRQLGCQQS